MFGTLGGPELFLILVIALIVFGPRKLPEMGRSLGQMLAEFRKASNDFRRTVEDEVDAEKVKRVEPKALPPDTTPPSVEAAAPPAESVSRDSAPPPIEPK